MDLKGKQLQAFCDALLPAFVDYGDLDVMTTLQLSTPLNRIAAQALPMNQVVLALVRWADARTSLEELLRAALRAVPGNTSLRRLAQELVLTSDAPPAADLEALLMPDVGMPNAV